MFIVDFFDYNDNNHYMCVEETFLAAKKKLIEYCKDVNFHVSKSFLKELEKPSNVESIKHDYKMAFNIYNVKFGETLDVLM
jgi:hypothetical protein